MNKNITEKEKELFEKIKGMSYAEALDKYLTESIAIELEKTHSGYMQPYTTLAVTNNYAVLRNAKKRIYENRGSEIRNKETWTSCTFIFGVASLFCIFGHCTMGMITCIPVFLICLCFYISNKLDKKGKEQ